MGTVGYMSPEQVRGESTDGRTDIFSFGAVLYEMLSNQRAFKKDTATETMVATLREEPTSLLELVPTLPAGLQRIVLHCLEKEPAQRFQSAADLAFALDSVIDISTASQRAMMIQPRTLSKKWFAVLGAVIFGLAVTGFLWLRLFPRIRPSLLAPKAVTSDTAEGVVGSSTMLPPDEPKQITIQDTSRFEWFDPETHNPRAWYTILPDRTIKFFDRPGFVPGTRQMLLPVTPEFLSNLHRFPATAVTPPIPKIQSAPEPRQPTAPANVNDLNAGGAATTQSLQAIANRAQSALDKEDYRTAIDLCTRVIGLSPGDQPCAAIRQHAAVKLADQYVDESTRCWEKGDFEKALQWAERALELDPANKTAEKLKNLATQMKKQTQSR